MTWLMWAAIALPLYLTCATFVYVARRRDAGEAFWCAFGVLAFSGVAIAFASAAFAQAPQRHHPVADLPLHEKFYSTWYMPDEPTKSCCDKADCYPTEIRTIASELHARRREDGRWLRIPEAKIERRRDNPDGRNHLCAPPPNASYPVDTVFCFALGGGT